MHKFLAMVLAISISLWGVLSAETGHAQNGSEEAKQVTKALWTLNDFYQDPSMGWFRQNLHRARGVLIMPLLVKMGFIGGFQKLRR